MIIETGAFGSVKVLKYEHLKSYPLPWNWQHIIKNHINTFAILYVEIFHNVVL